MLYKLKYKRKDQWFWRSIKNVKGHKFDENTGRLDVFITNGLISLVDWNKCDVKLGNDFILAQKESMEEEASAAIKLKKD